MQISYLTPTFLLFSPFCFLTAILALPHNADADSCLSLVSGSETNTSITCLFAGAVAGEFHDYYGSDDAFLYPVLSLHWRSFYVEDTEAGVYFAGDVTGGNYWYSAIHVAYEAAPFDVRDHPRFRELSEKDDSVNLGLNLALGGFWGLLNLKYNEDITDVHEGHDVTFDYTYHISFDNVILSPYLGLRYINDHKSHYYYGVNQNETVPQLPAFDAEAAYEYSAGINAFFELAPRWSAFVDVQSTKLDGQARRSPLLEYDEQYVIAVGALYQF